MIIGAILGRAYERGIWHRRLLEKSGVFPIGVENGGPEALTLLSHSESITGTLSAIAIEIERLGEGQRFLTKILTERDVTPRS
jgi:hypothetical protein